VRKVQPPQPEHFSKGASDSEKTFAGKLQLDRKNIFVRKTQLGAKSNFFRKECPLSKKILSHGSRELPLASSSLLFSWNFLAQPLDKNAASPPAKRASPAQNKKSSRASSKGHFPYDHRPNKKLRKPSDGKPRKRNSDKKPTLAQRQTA
jgi:hypothetical protein